MSYYYFYILTIKRKMQKIIIEQFMKAFKELLELIKQNNEKIESLEQQIHELTIEIRNKDFTN